MRTAKNSPAAARPTFGVVGDFWVEEGDGKRTVLNGSQGRLLAALVAFGRSGVSAEELREIIWTEQDSQPKSARSVRMGISRLRKRLPMAEIVAERTRYVLRAPVGQLDIDCLIQLEADSEVIVTADHLAWALAGRPFDGMDLPEREQQLVYSAEHAQRQLVDRFCATSPGLVDAATSALLEMFVVSQPFEDELLEQVIVCLTGGGRAKVVGQLRERVDRARREHQEADQPGEAAALVGQSPLGPSPSGTSKVERPRVLPSELARQLGQKLVGRAEVLASLSSGKRTLLVGPSGAGKTRLLAALAEQEVERGCWVTYLSADQQDAAVPYGPFLLALPELRQALDAQPSAVGQSDETGAGQGDEPGVDRAARSRIWTLTQSLLEQRSAGSGHHLLIDDAHELDQDSLALLHLLMKAESNFDLSYTIAGADYGANSDRLSLRSTLGDEATDTVSVAGLGLEPLKLLVWQTFPDATLESQNALAEELLAATGGLPAFAVPLLQLADPKTLLLPERSPGGSERTRLLAGLSPNAKAIGGIAAVLDPALSFDTLCVLSELSQAAVISALDELWGRNLLVDVDVDVDADVDIGQGQLRFSHNVVKDAFVHELPHFRRRKLHHAALAHVTDVHEIARHKAGADLLVDRQDAYGAVRESAAAYAEDRQWRRVIAQLRLCQAMGAPLSIEDMTLMASALDRSGSDGSSSRETAFNEAIELGDQPAALRAALSGLPEAERPDGDPARLRLLENIKAQRLAKSSQFMHAVQLSRQLALGGRAVEANGQADAAIALADSADERAAAHIAKWTAMRHTGVGNHPLPQELDHSLSESMAIRLAQMRAIAEFEAGERETAIALHEDFERRAQIFGDPLRVWHAMGYRAMLEFDAGNLETSEQIAQEAYKHGQLHGLQEATATRAGQVFATFYAKRQHSLLVDGMRRIFPNIERSSLAHAAFTASLASTGKPEDIAEASENAVGLLTDALERVRSPSVVVVALMAEILRNSPTDELKPLAHSAERFLKLFGDSWIVVGFGVANLGPIARYLSFLAHDRDERVTYLRSAVAAADKFGARTWQVLTRLDLADVVGTDAPIDEARAIAAPSTDLLGLIEVRTRR